MKILSAQVLGIHAVLVEVEVSATTGTPCVEMTGLSDPAIRESKVRVETALRNNGCTLPPGRIGVDLAPADLRKSGTHYDLPIAVAMLHAKGSVPHFAGARTGYLFAGELSLTGELRPIRGVLSMAVAARDHGLKGIVVPLGNVREAAVVIGIEAIGVQSFSEVVAWLGGERIEPTEVPTISLLHDLAQTKFGINGSQPDFSEVRGQEHVKRVLEIAAAGGHNLLMVGPPGSGKTMLARRLPTILPPLSLAEAIETTKIYSVAGLLAENEAQVTRRPFRAPHHTISDAGLVGGGSVPHPGEASLAHNGVLFLDELQEFKKYVLEVLRQPMEDKRVTLTRGGTGITYPSDFMLVGAMNPCPCGFRGDPQRECRCTSEQILRYKARLGGFLLDRMDIRVDVPVVRYRELKAAPEAESSATIRARVEATRDIQRRRFASVPRVYANAQMGPRLLRQHCVLANEGHTLFSSVIDRLGMSARAHDRILRVARTIADLGGYENISTAHLAEAIQYGRDADVVCPAP